MEELLDKYGYFAILVGTILEGGTMLSMAGFLAHQGYMKLIPWVIAAGFAGNFVDTLICYWVGRRGGEAVARKRPNWQPRLQDLHNWLEDYETLTIVGIRFIPGMRTIGGMAIGIARIPPARFLLLNALGALLWASSIGVIGYLFGHLLKIAMGDIKRYELPILLVLAVCGLLTWILFRKFRGSEQQAGAKNPR